MDSFNKRLLVVILLGFSSGLPLSLLSSTLQAWYASSGLSVLATATLSLISLPYAYRTLIGPIVDRYPLLQRLGRRRSWIAVMQVLLLLGFNLISWLTPTEYPLLLASLALFLATCSAVQDLAIDAYRIEYLPKNEHALGASLAVFGYRLALLLSGGLALVMAEHLGWVFVYRSMGLLMSIGLFAVLYSHESPHEINREVRFTRLFVEPIKELITRPQFIQLCLFLIFFKLGEAFTTTTSGIVMPFLIQGLGFSLATIGYINKILGVIATILGGVSAGFLLLRYPLYPLLFVFGLLQAVTNVFFVLLAWFGQHLSLLAIAVFFDNFAAGMGTTALIALLMRLVHKQFTGTQFSLLVTLSTIPRIFSGPFAAGLQMRFGWLGLYLLSVFFALLFIPFLITIKEQTRERVDSLDSNGASAESL